MDGNIWYNDHSVHFKPVLYIFSQTNNQHRFVRMLFNRNRPCVKSEKCWMCYQLLFGSDTVCQLCRWPFRNFPLRVPSFILVADGAWFLQQEAKQNILQLKRFLFCVLTTSRSTKLIASLLNYLFVSLTINETFPKHPNSVCACTILYRAQID